MNFFIIWYKIYFLFVNYTINTSVNLVIWIYLSTVPLFPILTCMYWNCFVHRLAYQQEGDQIELFASTRSKKVIQMLFKLSASYRASSVVSSSSTTVVSIQNYWWAVLVIFSSWFIFLDFFQLVDSNFWISKVKFLQNITAVQVTV